MIMGLAVISSKGIGLLKTKVEGEDIKLRIHQEMPLKTIGIRNLARKVLSKGLAQIKNTLASSKDK